MASYTILLVEDDAELRGALRSYLELKGYSVSERETGKGCREYLEQNRPDAIVMDYSLPDSEGLQLLRHIRAVDSSVPVLMMTGHATIDLAVRSIKEGAEQFIAKPLEMSVLLKLLEKALDNRRFIRRELAVKNKVVRYRRDPFLGSSESIRQLHSAAQRVVGSNYPILIQGETGTGKGVLAEWLTKEGPRSNEALVDLNCAGLNRELLESDLFGHEKGAFTGAITQKTGLLEVAHRGTLFLDEIGDMDIAIQPKLLKVLDETRFRRLGGIRDHSVDIHLIAATHQDMGALVASGRFRSDLYFRVSTIPLSIPPLRDRIGDIPILANWFLERLQEDLNSSKLQFGPGVLRALEGYRWPGNIRELRNVLERAALLCSNGMISTEDLHFQLVRPSVAAAQAGAAQAQSPDMTLQQIERQHIAHVLRSENGKVDRAAVRLGIPRSSLYAKIKQYGITQD
jgi:DNA-binding NtrC family response regulator